MSSSAHDKSKTGAVPVRDNNVDKALRALKKKLQREGVFREMKLRQHFEKPSEKRAREDGEARSRNKKNKIKRGAADAGMTIAEYKNWLKNNRGRSPR